MRPAFDQDQSSIIANAEHYSCKWLLFDTAVRAGQRRPLFARTAQGEEGD